MQRTLDRGEGGGLTWRASEPVHCASSAPYIPRALRGASRYGRGLRRACEGLGQRSIEASGHPPLFCCIYGTPEHLRILIALLRTPAGLTGFCRMAPSYPGFLRSSSENQRSVS